jgi:predicted RNA-binding protein YlxR (DUF448 family)
VRIVRGADGSVVVDPTGKKSGRGAYLCHSPECWQAALTRGVLQRGLKIESIGEDDLHNLNVFAQRLSTSSPPSA